tara:strand:- start:627 stop:1181 length:555 start_codon:yes stop_codon:yes gene_type:complete
MAYELTPDELAALKKSKIGSEERDADRPEKVDEGREARATADATTKSKLLEGGGVFLDVGEGGQLTEIAAAESVPTAVRVKLNAKAIADDLRKDVFLLDNTYYVSASSRDVCERSMELQGIKISKTDLTTVAGTPGQRSRFNVFNKHHPKYYASGSHKSDGGGPRIQGPAGGPGSCKFVIIQRA